MGCEKSVTFSNRAQRTQGTVLFFKQVVWVERSRMEMVSVQTGPIIPHLQKGVLFEVQPARPPDSQRRWLMRHLSQSAAASYSEADSAPGRVSEKERERNYAEHAVTVGKKIICHFLGYDLVTVTVYSNYWTSRPGTFSSKAHISSNASHDISSWKLFFPFSVKTSKETNTSIQNREFLMDMNG